MIRRNRYTPAQLIRLVLARTGWSQLALSRYLDIAPQTVTRTVRGWTMPEIDRSNSKWLWRLAELAGVKIDDVVIKRNGNGKAQVAAEN